MMGRILDRLRDLIRRWQLRHHEPLGYPDKGKCPDCKLPLGLSATIGGCGCYLHPGKRWS